MKKIILLLPLFFVIPALAANNSPATNSQQGRPTTSKSLATPTGNTVRNQNQVQTQNQGEDSQLMVNTQESEQLRDKNISTDTDIEESLDQVSSQIDSLEASTAKGKIAKQVGEIAQNQNQNQEQIKSDLNQLKSQNVIRKMLFGTNRSILASLQGQLEQNRLSIESLEQLKTQTKNQAELDQLQLTIDLMIYQNTSLQNKIEGEGQNRGLFGWFRNLF